MCERETDRQTDGQKQREHRFESGGGGQSDGGRLRDGGVFPSTGEGGGGAYRCTSQAQTVR